MMDQHNSISFDELNAATEILIAVIAIDGNVDQNEINQFKLQINGASFNGHPELQKRAVEYVEGQLSKSLTAFNQDYIMKRIDRVKSSELREDVVMAAIAIAFADRHYHDKERSAVNALREAWDM